MFSTHSFVRIALLASAGAMLPSALGAQSIFPDKNLETVVRQYVFAKRDNDQPLTEDDVKNISTIKGRGKKIASLAGLEKCRSLALLEIPKNEVSDLGPIKDLKRLQSLDVAENKIEDIGPLENLTALQFVELSGNQVASLAPLAKLANLRSLYLSRNKISDLAPLHGLEKLWSLYLDGNQVTDLKPIETLKGLDRLDIKDNQVTELAPIAGYTELRYLFLQNNKISDLGVLVTMAEKDNAGQKSFAPFWRVYLAGNPLGAAAKGEQVEKLKAAGVRLFLEDDTK
jgi:internalin A